jgi:hypothetical protein
MTDVLDIDLAPAPAARRSSRTAATAWSHEAQQASALPPAPVVHDALHDLVVRVSLQG